jgi:hypothetical protein
MVSAVHRHNPTLSTLKIPRIAWAREVDLVSVAEAAVGLVEWVPAPVDLVEWVPAPVDLAE